MSKRSPKSVEEKLEIVLKYQEGQSIGQLIKDYRVSDHTIKEWMRKYQTDGIDGLKESCTWKHYSLELKQTAIDEYLSGQGRCLNFYYFIVYLTGSSST